jgi:hypothetical protein
VGHSKSRSHKNQLGRGKTLASKIGVSGATLSAKIQKVREDHPEKTGRQAAGMAAGILRGRKR